MKLLKHVLFLAILFPTIANAAFPSGQWQATTYVLNTGTLYSSVGICLQSGSPNQWYTTSAASASGRWVLKGDDLYLHGNLTTLGHSESSELTRINSRLFTGHWQEWLGAGSDLYLTVKFEFRSLTCLPPI